MGTTDIRPCELLPQVIALAHIAGKHIMAVYSTDFAVEHKDDRSPLTEADMAAHRAIVEGLAKLTPGIPVLSEESADVPYTERAQWRTYWLVDPLDGTREFVKRNGEFTVNIALVQEQRAVLGVVQVPVSGVCYYACEGGGAYKHTPGGSPQRLRVTAERGARARVAGSRSHQGDSLQAFLARLGDHELVSIGSSLKSCYVAEGIVDIYPRLGPTSEWDTAAAQCIVEEAGGQMTDTSLRPLRYNTKESLLNPHFLVFGDRSHDWTRYLEAAGII